MKKDPYKLWIEIAPDYFPDYYVITSGTNRGIYSDYDSAFEAAWTSDYDIKIFRNKERARSYYKKKMKEIALNELV